jgi:hypothetical protein
MAGQASALSILVDEKRVANLVQQKTGAKAFLKSGCNLCLFCTFVALFTALALSEPLSLHRSFEAYLRHRFDDNAGMRLEEVNSIEDFYTYWNRSLIPGLYSNNTLQYTFPGVALQNMLKVDGETANNRLFGIVRVRMKKVIGETDCVQDVYKEYFHTCYPSFSVENEDVAEFGPTDVITGAAFKYTADAAGSSWSGWLATYDSGGFLQKMDSNYSASIEVVSDLKTLNFVSAATRAIFFEFTIYNLNMGMYAVCRIAFEVSPMGSWLKTFSIDMLDQRHMSALGDGGLMAWVYLIMEAVLVIFVVRYLCEEASEFIGVTNVKTYNPLKKLRIKWGYFTDGWNVIDWTNLILIVVVMIFRIQNWGLGGEVIDNTNSFIGTNIPVSDFADFNAVVVSVTTIRQLQAFNAVLTWFKAVKYVNILPYISTFIETMALAWEFLAGFTLVFFTTFMGFCLSYCTAFGESISDFRTIPRAFMFLLRSFVGNADMRLVYDANPVIGSMLIVMFVVGMIFINMNLFYAILISSLSEARQTQEVEQNKKMENFTDKILGFLETVSRVLQLQQRFRGCFPGLYARMKKWEKERMELEKQRDQMVRDREKAKMPVADIDATLGSANPNFSRRKARKFKQDIDDDDDDIKSVAESEPDLGALRFKENLVPPPNWHGRSNNALTDFADGFAEGFAEGMDKAMGTNGMSDMLKQAMKEREEYERQEYAKDKVLDATEYIVETVKDRCRGARQLVLSEMGDARQVLQGIGSVLEVLGRRARSLEAQQELVLPPESIARVRDELSAE